METKDKKINVNEFLNNLKNEGIKNVKKIKITLSFDFDVSDYIGENWDNTAKDFFFDFLEDLKIINPIINYPIEKSEINTEIEIKEYYEDKD